MGLGSQPVEDDLGDVRRALAAGLRTSMADRGEGAGDERHHLLNGDVIADGACRLRTIEQVRDLAREVRRDVRGCGAQIELGSRERALHGDVLGARSHHPRQLREEGRRGIASGGEDSGPRRQLLKLIDRDREVQRFLGREVPVDGAGADARTAGYLIE